jgi:hypothetical protein
LPEDVVEHSILTSEAVDDVFNQLVAGAFLLQDLAGFFVAHARLETVYI